LTNWRAPLSMQRGYRTRVGGLPLWVLDMALAGD